MINTTANDSEGSVLGRDATVPVGLHGYTVALETVTGAHGSNAALISLLTALELKGIIIDGSS